SMYQPIREQVKSINIDQIKINHGSLTIYDGPTHRNTTQLNDLGIMIANLKVDSSSQYDNTRFLFAKKMDVSAKNYVTATADSLYYFKTATLNFSAEDQRAVFHHVSLVPRSTKEQFNKNSPFRNE